MFHAQTQSSYMCVQSLVRLAPVLIWIACSGAHWQFRMCPLGYFVQFCDTSYCISCDHLSWCGVLNFAIILAIVDSDLTVCNY